MSEVSDAIAIAGVAVGAAAGVAAWISVAKSRRAEQLVMNLDARIERVERIARVKFEFIPIADGRVGLRNIGTDVARMVQLDASTMTHAAIDRETIFGSCPPGKVWPMMFTPSPGRDLPESIRVTWTEPFEGEQWVWLPELLRQL